jgi:hypothetical protein
MKKLIETESLESLLKALCRAENAMNYPYAIGGIQDAIQKVSTILDDKNKEYPRWAVVSADIKVHPAKKIGPDHVLDDLYCTVDTKILGSFDTVNEASNFLEKESAGKRGAFMVVEVKE